GIRGFHVTGVQTCALPISQDAPVPAGAPPAGDTLLGWLQRDLRDDRPPPPTARAERVVRADDRSVQVHACHGLARQVEVLREVQDRRAPCRERGEATARAW